MMGYNYDSLGNELQRWIARPEDNYTYETEVWINKHRTEDKQLTAKQQKYLQLVVFLGLRIEEFNPLFY